MKRVWLAGVLIALVTVTVVVGAGVALRERDYRALLARGDAALAGGQTYQAIEAFSGAIALRDDVMIAYLKRGEAYRLRGENEAARRDLRSATRLDPTALRPAELLGDVNYDLERFTNAVENYRTYVAIDDQTPRVLVKLGLACFRAGDPGKALVPLQQALALDGKLADAHYVLGLCLKDLGRTDDAITAFRDAVGANPAMVPAREELARVLASAGRDREAVDQLEAVAALEPMRPERQTVAALAYARMGRTESAINLLGLAAERVPDNTPIFQTVGRIWLEAATPKRDRVALGKARAALEPLANRPGASGETLALYGRTLVLSGDAVQGEAYLRQAVATLPLLPDTLLWHADAAERLGRTTLARESLDGWIALAPDHAPGRAAVLIRAAGLARLAGDNAAAVDDLERALQLPSPPVQAFVDLARLQFDLANPAAARQVVARGIALFPRDPALLALARRAP